MILSHSTAGMSLVLGLARIDWTTKDSIRLSVPAVLFGRGSRNVVDFFLSPTRFEPAHARERENICGETPRALANCATRSDRKVAAS